MSDLFFERSSTHKKTICDVCSLKKTEPRGSEIFRMIAGDTILLTVCATHLSEILESINGRIPMRMKKTANQQAISVATKRPSETKPAFIDRVARRLGTKCSTCIK